MNLKHILAAAVAASLTILAAPAFAADVLASSQAAASAPAVPPGCYLNKVQHSFLPSESDFSASPKLVTLTFSDGTNGKYNLAFANHVRDAGTWGAAADGKYIQKSATADANGNPVGPKIWRRVDENPVKNYDGTVAVSRLDLYPKGSYVSVNGGGPLLVNDATQDNTVMLASVWSANFTDLDSAMVCPVDKDGKPVLPPTPAK